MDDEFGEIVCSFKKNATEVIGGGFSTFKGKHYFYLRVFTPSLDDPDAIVPTNKGLSLNLEMLPEVLEGVVAIRDVMSNNKVTKVIHKNTKEEVRIGVNEYKGNTLASIRVFAQFGKDESAERQPTQKGITVSLQKLEDLVSLLATLKGAVPQ
jgi:hypothetical protein